MKCIIILLCDLCSDRLERPYVTAYVKAYSIPERCVGESRFCELFRLPVSVCIALIDNRDHSVAAVGSSGACPIRPLFVAY